MKKFIIAAALALIAPLAFAHDGGGNSQGGSYGGAYVAGGYAGSSYKGSVSGSSSSTTSGGSESATSATGNGGTSNKTTNFGGGTAFAGGSLSPTGVTTTTNNASWSGGKSTSANWGTGATGSTDGGTGTNVNSSASGKFSAKDFGGQFAGGIVVGQFGGTTGNNGHDHY